MGNLINDDFNLLKNFPREPCVGFLFFLLLLKRINRQLVLPKIFMWICLWYMNKRVFLILFQVFVNVYRSTKVSIWLH